MRLSYAIVSHNRKHALLSTLAALPARTGLPAGDWETWVVDNASIDGSANAVRDRFPQANLIALNEDAGRDAVNGAVAQCAGDYIVCLNEGSLPADPSVVTGMIDYLDANPGVGAVVANVTQPDGSTLAPTLPSLVMGGATCYRRELLQLVTTGNELELSFRIWAAGYRIERFENVVFEQASFREHSRDWLARQVEALSDRLGVARLFLPENLRNAYGEDWTAQYGALGAANGISGLMSEAGRRRAGEPTPLHFAAIESIFGLHQQASLVQNWSHRNGIRRVVLAGFGENIFATYSACEQAGLEISAIADAEPAFAGTTYRGVKVVGLKDATVDYCDGVIVTNVNPAEIDAVVASIKSCFNGPVLRLWEPKVLAKPVRRYQLAA